MPKKYWSQELVVTPKGNRIVPSLDSFLEEKASEARNKAASHILTQTEPNVPILPSRAPWSIVAAILGMSDEDRIKYFGTTDPQTCIYTATSQYEDAGAKVSGNKTFRQNPAAYGFEEVPMDSVAEGDLVQFTDLVGPHHSTLMTGRTNDGEPTLSYSNGNSIPYDIVEDGDTIFTMVRDNKLSTLTDALGTPAAFRYKGSPQKQAEWRREYFSRYNLNPIDFMPAMEASQPAHIEQPDALRVVKPQIATAINKKAEGGSLKPETAWDALSMREKAEMMRVAVRNGITNLQEIRQKYNEFAEGGNTENDEEELPPIVPFEHKPEVIITPDQEYNQYLNTLPDNQRFTPNDAYDSYFYWKLNGRPRNFEEAYNKGMFHYDHSDNGYHANSIAFGEDGVGYFMKPKTHDTVHMETDWYNKGIVTEEGGKRRPVNAEELKELEDFRRRFELTDDLNRPNYFMYAPRKQEHSLGGPLVEWALNEYAKGGGIHIKPSHKGRLTELKKRTGKSEAELYRTGSAATRKMITFARNARKWKHGGGGNLYGGESEDTQQMQIGREYWLHQDDKPSFFSLDFPINGGTLQEVVITGSKSKQEEARKQRLAEMQAVLNKYQNDYLTTSNDNTWVESRDLRVQATRQKNPHLAQRAVEGAKAHAAWAKEHPILNAISMGLGALPFAVAATPFMAVAGEAAYPVLTNPYVDAALTSGFAGHGMNHVVNEGINGWEDAVITSLEVAPLTKPIRAAGRAVSSTALNTQLQQVGKGMGNPFSLAEGIYNYTRRKPIPFAEKQAAAQRMEDFIHSPEYVQRQVDAGLTPSEITDFQDMVARRLNGGNFPAYTMKRRSDGISIALPKPFGGIYMREGMPASDFVNAFDHEVAHYSTSNFTKADNELLGWLNKENPSVMEKVMGYNINKVPYRPESDAAKVRTARGLSPNTKNLNYYRDEQELRSNAYAMLQEAQRRGISIDDLVDQYTMQSTGEIFNFAPAPLRYLNYAYTPENMKKFIKGFLSLSTPLTLGIKYAHQNDE